MSARTAFDEENSAKKEDPALENQRKRFNKLVSSSPGPVPIDVLERLVFGSINPRTGKDEEGHSYSPETIQIALDIAEEEMKRIKALPKTDASIYFASAGGPGAGKSTALLKEVVKTFQDAYYKEHEQELAFGITPEDWTEPSLSKALGQIFSKIPAAFISPDRHGILSLAKHFRKEPTSDEAFYSEHRWLSNFISNFLTNVAFNKEVNIVHDTTMSSERAVKNLDGMGKNVTKIILMQGAPFETREEAADKRNKIFYQSYKANVSEQDQAFNKLIGTIVEKSDIVLVGWRDAADAEAQIVAKISHGEVLILDKKGFDAYCDNYSEMSELRKNLVVVNEKEFKDPIPDVMAKVVKSMPTDGANYPGMKNPMNGVKEPRPS